MIGTPRFQNGSIIRVKNKTTLDTWAFRFYEEVEGRRVYRKQRIGTIREFPHRADAQRAALRLRANINSDVRSPETVAALVHHYKKHELTEVSGKRSSACEVYAGFLSTHIEPKWGSVRLHEVRAFEVEDWLRSLKLAPATKSKIRGIMSAVFAHAVRYCIVPLNPIRGVRCSAKRLREPDVLTPQEFANLVGELPKRERVMVMLAGTTGLRRSELIALLWRDVDFDSLEVDVNKSCVRAQIGATKTAASARPVPIHRVIADALAEWRKTTLYSGEDDLLFPSVRKNGKAPVWPDMILKKIIRPAAERAGIKKRLGWHTFRHSLATTLRSISVDVKTTQELLRHANSRTTLDLYTQAISSNKREANARVTQILLPGAGTVQHPSTPTKEDEVAVDPACC